jgi:acetolactate synthase I/II/III large subunit
LQEAFYLARTGRPGPVLIDVPKDIQQQLHVPDWEAPMAITGYMNRLPGAPVRETLEPVVAALRVRNLRAMFAHPVCLQAVCA